MSEARVDTEAATEPEQPERLHGGWLAARRLKAHGVQKLFTLSGGHLFSIYDGCLKEGLSIVDVRHESTAAFAAEGWSKVTRQTGACALTAGPGVTNGMSAMASAQANHSPLVVMGGRAPAGRWGQGSLQEIDHVPFVRPLCKMAATAQGPEEIQDLLDEAFAAASRPHGGPAFVDFPLDYVFMEAPERASGAEDLSAAGSARAQGSERGAGSSTGAREDGASADGRAAGEDGGADRSPGLRRAADAGAIERAGALLRGAERPVIMAGSDLYWGRGEGALLELARSLRIPSYLNGLARGCVPADDELFFSRTRSQALAGADVALLVGVPMDFRLGFGAAFGDDTEVIAIDVTEPERPHPRSVAVELYGGLPQTLGDLRLAAGGQALASEEWVGALRSAENERREAERGELEDDRVPLHPMRVYAELAQVIDRDAIVIGDGGDFVSYAGRMIDSFEPGCWLDPGPFGCLGAGPGYALAAKLAHPQRQVVLLLGDGAFGFAGMEFDTLARHAANVVAVMGNNGIWGLEKHPMEFLYGYSVAAELRPGTRYETAVEALGAHGELVERPQELRGALERAFAAERAALVNVLTDPTVAYPRRANLA
jgi:acetolactate synthase-1/2/3 large subunit